VGLTMRGLPLECHLTFSLTFDFSFFLFNDNELDIVVQPFYEAMLLLVIGIDVFQGIARQLGEPIKILSHGHVSLIQLHEFLSFEPHQTRRHKMCMESIFELISRDSLSVGLRNAVRIPPIRGCTKQLVYSE
jgi:hypothetical protein